MNNKIKKNKEKVCCISYSNKKGGSETYINNIIKNSDINLDWFFFEISINKSFDIKSQRCLGELPKNFFKRIYYLFHISYEINNLGYKKIITFGFYPSLIGLLLKIIRPKIFWTITQREEYSWANKLHKLIIYLLQLMSNRIETNALHIYKNISIKPFFKRKTFYCPNLIWENEIKQFNSSFLNKNLINQKRKKILFIANNRPLKSVNLAIEVFKRISLKDKNIIFIIVGRGYEQIKKKLFLKNLFKKNFLFTGELSNKEVRGIMQSGDLLLFLSKTEASPNTVIESIYNNLPVIARPIEALKNIIGNDQNGYFLKELDPQSICDFILNKIYSENELLSLKERMKKSIISNKKVYSNHTFCSLPIKNGFYIKEMIKID